MHYVQFYAEIRKILIGYCIYSSQLKFLLFWTDRPEQTVRIRSDATKCGIWSGSALFAIHPALF